MVPIYSILFSSNYFLKCSLVNCRPLSVLKDRGRPQVTKFDNKTTALIDLHWLPVTFRVQFKLLLFVYKSLHNQSPSYIKDLLFLKPAANYALRSSAQSLLFVPKVNCSALVDRAFAHAAPVLWNSLPLTTRTSSSVAIFKKQLETFLFKKAFNLLK